MNFSSFDKFQEEIENKFDSAKNQHRLSFENINNVKCINESIIKTETAHNLENTNELISNNICFHTKMPNLHHSKFASVIWLNDKCIWCKIFKSS